MGELLLEDEIDDEIDDTVSDAFEPILDAADEFQQRTDATTILEPAEAAVPDSKPA